MIGGRCWSVWRGCCKLALCLAALVLLGGCREEPAGTYAHIIFDLKHESFTNAEGEEIHWSLMSDGTYNLPPTGDMECFGWNGAIATWVLLDVPYSKSFTVQTREHMDGATAPFAVEFCLDEDRFLSEIYIDSDLEGSATVYDNNVVELEGDSTEMYVRFTVMEGERQIGYVLEGRTAQNALISFNGGTIAASGMIGEYTVSKLDMDRYNLNDTPLDIKTYQREQN